MDNTLTPDFGSIDSRQQTTEPVVAESTIELPITDQDLLAVVRSRNSVDLAFTKGVIKLDDRRKLNEDMWVGKQLDETGLYNWQVPYKDNLIWQDLENRIAIAVGRMPQIIVTPPSGKQEDKDMAESLEKVLEIKIQNDASKRIVKDGLRQLHLYLTAAIKCRWDKNIGKHGDFIFELVNPRRLQLDTSAVIPHDGFTADNCEIISEWIEEPAGVVLSKFPKKREDLMRAFGFVRGTPRQMMAKIRYQEVWFTWYDQQGKLIEGVAWIYQSIVMDKMKNPYFDWQGYESVDENDEVEELFFNYFERPRKPYILFSYQNLGRSPYEDTTAVEQSIPLQKIVNKRGRQITEISDRAIPKLAFAGSFISKEEARRVTNDPDEHIWMEQATDVRQAVQFIPAQPPSPVLLQDMMQNRNQIDSKFNTHATTRGDRVPNESGVSKQITREGDLAMSDDLADVTVQRVMYEMAGWATQMMKLMYDKEHYVKDIGKDGEMIEVALKRDAIADGVAVNVKASSTDKQQKRVDAQMEVARKMTDPLTYFEDMDKPNPKDLTKKLILFQMGAGGDPNAMLAYTQAIGVDLGMQPPAPETPPGSEAPAAPTGEAPAGAPPSEPGATPQDTNLDPNGSVSGAGGDAEQAQADLQSILSGQMVEPATVSPDYIAVFIQFVQSPEFEQLSPEQQQMLQQFVARMQELAAGGQ